MRIRIIDAFTDRPYAGNPAAVCLLDGDGWPEESWMRGLAAELNLPMTAFARRDGADWALRWFTPVVEERLCGHATLATAHALHVDNEGPVSVRFATLSGILSARTADDGTVTLDFPASPVVDAPAPAGLADALGAPPQSVHSAPGLRDVIAVLADERAVRDLDPDLGALAQIGEREGLRGITVTALAAPGADGYDFVSRFFSPHQGIPEDPVTGSAHTALALLWAPRIGRDELTGLQASPRGGLVRTAVRGDRVHLGGRAVTVLDGALERAAAA
jgi:PhzF family phenazine biosynthesis protein